MARYIGVDLEASRIKIAILRSAGRTIEVEKLVNFKRNISDETTQEAQAIWNEIKRAIGDSPDFLSVNFNSEQGFVRSLEIPIAVRRRLVEVLPFELEAQLPCDLEEIVFDHRIQKETPSNLSVLVVVARIVDVQESIQRIKDGLGREPDHVVPSAFALAELTALVPEFRSNAMLAILNLEVDHTEFVCISNMEPVFARTLSQNLHSMRVNPQYFIRELKQTLLAFRAQFQAQPQKFYLTGSGALTTGLTQWFSHELTVAVELLPLESIAGLGSKVRSDGHAFTRAVSVALASAPRKRSFDLRRGPLAFERGYGFLREKVPLVVGLSASILVAYVLSIWAQIYGINRDQKELQSRLSQVSKSVLGESTTDLERISKLLNAKSTTLDDDPLPHADAADVLMQMSLLIPDKIKHDLERLEVQRNVPSGFKIVILGIAPSLESITSIESALKEYRCFQNLTINKKSKMVGDDRQKYTLETELRCPEDAGGVKPKSSSTTQTAGAK